MTRAERIAILLLLLAAVFLALVVVTEAQAAEVSGPPDLVAAYSSAVSWWGSEPEWCGTVELHREPISGSEAGHAEEAYKPGGACGIAISEAQTGCWLEETMRHEVGHLRGLEHSTDPNSIMYPTGSVDAPLCAAERLVEYEGWLAHERARCHHHSRRECWATVHGIRGEVVRRRASTAAAEAAVTK